VLSARRRRPKVPRFGGVALGGAALCAALCAAPLVLEQYALYLASLTLVYLIAAIGLNLTLGYAGQISLAHGAFMAFGAYAAALLGRAGAPFELGLAAGTATAFFWGLMLGFPALRVKHHYLAMVTLGFNIIVFIALRNWQSLTGGSFGILGVARPRWGPILFQTDRAYYYYILAWAALAVGSAHRVLHSRWGRAFRAIRQNEMRAQVVGVNLRSYKLMAFAIGAAYAGIGGALFAPLLTYIDPTAFTLDRSFQLLLMVVIGGLGRFEGPFIGAAVVTVLPEALRVSQGFYLIVFALAVMLMMLFMPAGLIGVWDWTRDRRGRAPRRAGPTAPPVTAPGTK
jgi:branched-chain amino acid transport system permease protein